MTIILFCVLVTAATLGYVFYLPGSLQAGEEKSQAAYLLERKEVVDENLRDLNFEFNAGKFLETDYQAMKKSLEEEAAGLQAELSQLEEAGLLISSMTRRTKGNKG